MDTRHQQYRRNWAWVGLAAASFLALAAFGWQEGRDSGPGETAEGRPEPAAPAWQAAAQASAAGTAASGPVLGGTARAPQDRPELRRTTSMVVADWGRYPAGLTDAIAQALREQDGPGAYELVRILSRCEGLPQEIERARQQLSELQAQGVLKPMDRDFVRKLMDLLQRDQAHCQTLTGDPRLQRRQLLEVAARQGVDGAGMTLYLAGVAEPWVTQQVLREAERGHEMALDALASGELPQATRLQRDAAAEALLRSAEQPSANPVAARRLRDRLASIARQRVKEAWLADPGNPARIAAAKAVYQGEPVPPLQATADPQVRSLADRYLDTLRKRQAAKDF